MLAVHQIPQMWVTQGNRDIEGERERKRVRRMFSLLCWKAVETPGVKVQKSLKYIDTHTERRGLGRKQPSFKTHFKCFSGLQLQTAICISPGHFNPSLRTTALQGETITIIMALNIASY